MERLHENPWFSLLHQVVERPVGGVCDYYTVDFPRPAVGVVARRDGRYLLIRQYRFIVDEVVWAIPSGSVEPGEPPARAALRELVEETGYAADRVEHILGFYPSYGATNQRFELFLADGVRATDRDFDPDETLEVGWFDRREIIEMLLSNQIVDGLSLAPLATLLLQEEVSR